MFEKLKECMEADIMGDCLVLLLYGPPGDIALYFCLSPDTFRSRQLLLSRNARRFILSRLYL